MKLFLDSAKVEEIQHALEHWALDGVTTNPRHVAATGKAAVEVYSEIAQLVQGTDVPVSVEVDPELDHWEQIVQQGEELARLSPNFVIKVGASEAGFRAIRELKRRGVRTNATLIFTVVQAWHAARAGADYISPFVGWREEFGDSGLELLGQVRQMLDNFGYRSQIIAAAMRNPRQIAEAALAGCHCVTAGKAVYEQSFNNPFTDLGVRRFAEAYRRTLAPA